MKDCPLKGWNGWVMRTRRVDATEKPAFRVELQEAIEGALFVVAKGL
jgi:hypothetical protein